jgi:hypothetical protein
MLTVDAQTAATARNLAARCVKNGTLDTVTERAWLLLNFPRRSSVTLYMGYDPKVAELIAEAAKKVVIETFEYLLAMQGEILPLRAALTLDDAGGDHSKLGTIQDFLVEPVMKEVTPQRCFLKQGLFGRWFIVRAENQYFGWSGSWWVPITEDCQPAGQLAGNVQAYNFGTKEAATEYAAEFGFVIGGEL